MNTILSLTVLPAPMEISYPFSSVLKFLRFQEHTKASDIIYVYCKCNKDNISNSLAKNNTTEKQQIMQRGMGLFSFYKRMGHEIV